MSEAAWKGRSDHSWQVAARGAIQDGQRRIVMRAADFAGSG
ncbi:hypothetical protein [Pseudoxanthomonas sp. z9]|nr:hypothetical protein [Pseudoxanthomonas sp. z9]